MVVCGFVGAFGSNLDFQSGLVLHRGPDQTTTFRTRDALIEFSRLSVTGGESGNAPVVSQDGRWVVFLNGEIYNFRTLIRDRGLPPTDSDSLTLANGLAQFGLEFFSSIRGMFAGIVHDRLRSESFAFRDPLGEKPAFWAVHRGTMFVASEVSALLRIRDSRIRIPEQSFESFLRYGYVEEPGTISEGVFAVPRGSVMKIEDSELTLRGCLSLTGFSGSETSLSLGDLLETVLSEQCHVEVSSAVALSGGVDSSSLFSQLVGSRSASHPEIHAVSADVGAKRFAGRNEAALASRFARMNGINNEVVDCSGPFSVESLVDFSERSDQPIGDISGPLYTEIFRRCSELGVKVVFLGHGADEFFWGYPWVSRVVGQMTGAQRFGKRAGASPHSIPLKKFGGFDSSSDSETRAPGEPPFGSADVALVEGSPYARVRALVTHGYLTHNGFAQVDRLAMSFSIEPRSPLADSRIYGWSQENYANNSPAAFDKSLLRKALKARFPQLRAARRKRGFASPYGIFLDSLVSEIPFALSPEVLRQFSKWYSSVERDVSHVVLMRRLVLLTFWLRRWEKDGYEWEVIDLSKQGGRS